MFFNIQPRIGKRLVKEFPDRMRVSPVPITNHPLFSCWRSPPHAFQHYARGENPSPVLHRGFQGINDLSLPLQDFAAMTRVYLTRVTKVSPSPWGLMVEERDPLDANRCIVPSRVQLQRSSSTLHLATRIGALRRVQTACPLPVGGL